MKPLPTARRRYLYAVACLALLLTAAHLYGLRLNTSTSYPSGLYRLTDHRKNVRVGNW